ncbi:MAG TPA: efflux RND transporter periplasmic adaptor subunit, partial [Bacteroidales bacterium]|nr:efflux RND transporter periplasmic adaptor subunit [Bacteroidales bacterium]
MKFNKLLRYLLIAAVLLIVVAIIGKKRGMFGKPETIDVVVEKPAYRTLI